MSDPKRIQLRRTKGWRKPEGAIVVSRPSRWGNPYPVSERDLFARRDAVALFRRDLLDGEAWFCLCHGVRGVNVGADETCDGQHRFRMVTITPDDLAELRGRDIACWCPLDQPCHADVLLELANPS